MGFWVVFLFLISSIYMIDDHGWPMEISEIFWIFNENRREYLNEFSVNGIFQLKVSLTKKNKKGRIQI